MKYLSALVCALCFSVIGNADQADQPSVTRPKTISVDMPDRSLPELLRELADLYEINVVIPDTLRGRTSIKLRDVTWQQAFDVILRPVNYHYVQSNNIIKVVSDAPSSDREHSIKSDETNWLSLNLPWLTDLVLCATICVAIAHLVLFFGVMRDKPPEAVRFAPKFVWGIFVLIGGIVPLTAYWIIHHSNLRVVHRADSADPLAERTSEV